MQDMHRLFQIILISIVMDIPLRPWGCLLVCLTLCYPLLSYPSPQAFDSLSAQVTAPLYSTRTAMGKSLNNNNLTVYSLSMIPHSSLEELKGRKAILLSSEMHARQPYSVQLMLAIFQKTVAADHMDATLQFLREGVLLLYPFVNIDGYLAYQQHLNNYQEIRKNMNDNSSKCHKGRPGVDINRNFPSSFGTVSTSSNPCSEQYHGTAPFSEPEAMVFRQLFKDYRIEIAIDIHSYGNEWIYPYASDNTGSKVKQHQLYPLYQEVIAQLQAKGSKIESCIQSLGYIADGVYIDWALDQTALSLAFEVATAFTQDQHIEQTIQQALSDFEVVFRYGRRNYLQVTQNKDNLLIRSHYATLIQAKVDLGVADPQQIYLQHGSTKTLQVPVTARKAVITVGSQPPFEVILAQQPPEQLQLSQTAELPNSAVFVTLVICSLVMLFLGLVACSRCKQQQQRRKKTMAEIEERQFEQLGQSTSRAGTDNQI